MFKRLAFFSLSPSFHDIYFIPYMFFFAVVAVRPESKLPC